MDTTFPLVTSFMAKKLITFRAETDIQHAIDILVKKKISGAPIVDQHHKLVGILSEVDCLKLLVDGPYHKNPIPKGTVGDYMSTNLRTIQSDQNILYAAYEFVQHGLRRLPVLKHDKLVGQISRRDILRAIQQLRPNHKLVPDTWKVRMPIG